MEAQPTFLLYLETLQSFTLICSDVCYFLDGTVTTKYTDVFSCSQKLKKGILYELPGRQKHT